MKSKIKSFKMKKYKFVLTILFSISIISLTNAQCYEIGFATDSDNVIQPVTLNPNPMDLVEKGGVTVSTVTFCNKEDEIPNDPNGNTSISICGAKLFPVSDPSGTYADNFDWFQLDACWIGIIPQAKVTPKGCGTIQITWEATSNTTEENPENCLSVNIQPSGIVTANSCFDPTDDATNGCAFTTALGSLPVELLSFRATKRAKESVLDWSTSTEINNAKFEIERSSNGKDFTYIGEVDGHGTTSITQAYQFVDDSPVQNENYYRLKQIDFNGEHEYSSVKSLDFNLITSTSIFPNPVVDFAKVNTDVEGAVLRIYDVAGNMVLKNHLTPGKSVNTTSLISGVYLFKITDAQENELSVDRIVVSK